MLSPDMAKLSSERSSENQSQKVLPSLSKRSHDVALWLRTGWGIFLFPFIPNFSSFYIHLSRDPTSWQPRSDTWYKRSRAWFDGLLLKNNGWRQNKFSSHPHEHKSVSYFNCVKWSIFGPDWVDGRSIAWLEWVTKGVLHRSPWENRLNF
jgi:hypothetical protein